MAIERPNPEPRMAVAAQRWLQLAWLALVVPTALLYALGLSVFLQTPQLLCAPVTGACTEAGAAAALAQIGVSGLASQLISIGFIHIGVPVGCLLMAVFLFTRRPDRMITLAVSALLALYGPVINTGLVDIGLATLNLSALTRAYGLAFNVLISYVLLTFPNGRFVPGWSWLMLVLGLVVNAPALANATASSNEDPPAVYLTLLVALGLQIYRYRRVSTDTERQQSKWGLAGLAAFALNAVVWLAFVEPSSRAGVAGLPYVVLFAPINFVLILSFPAALLIASLRYRLWDIDVIIRRTLVYTTLTALLALLYFGIVVVGQNVLRGVTGASQSALVTVLSTLAIAALFGPLRRRVQTVIDRRFYRRSYDAARIIAAFGESLRDEVALDRVSARLVEVVDDTLQPSQAALWLKPPEKRR